MSMYDAVHVFVRPGRVEHTIKENMKIQKQFIPKKVEVQNRPMGSTTKVAPTGICHNQEG